MEGVTPVGLIEDTNGTLYGMTDSGGPGNDSVVYSLSLGLGQFINPQPPAGEVGRGALAVLKGMRSASVPNGDQSIASDIRDGDIRAQGSVPHIRLFVSRSDGFRGFGHRLAIVRDTSAPFDGNAPGALPEQPG